jgi:hypothetical protein
MEIPKMIFLPFLLVDKYNLVLVQVIETYERKLKKNQKITLSPI